MGREKGGTKTDACRATSVFPPADIASPTTTADSVAAAVAVVMAQNRFSIFCRRKTTGKEGRKKEEGDRSQDGIGYIGLLLLYSAVAEAERRNRQVVMLPSDGKRGRFLEASGSNDGKYPVSGIQI